MTDLDIGAVQSADSQSKRLDIGAVEKAEAVAAGTILKHVMQLAG